LGFITAPQAAQSWRIWQESSAIVSVSAWPQTGQVSVDDSFSRSPIG
jgi:hypothetical protein